MERHELSLLASLFLVPERVSDLERLGDFCEFCVTSLLGFQQLTILGLQEVGLSASDESNSCHWWFVFGVYILFGGVEEQGGSQRELGQIVDALEASP